MAGHRIFHALILSVIGGFMGDPALIASEVPMGAVQWATPPLATADIRGAVFSQNLLHVIGNAGYVGQRELFDSVSGVLSDPEVFWSQHLASNGGTGGDSRSAIFGLRVLDDGRTIYLGTSAADANLNNTPTYWFGPKTPVAAAQVSVTGELVTATSAGLLAGSNDFQASVGSLTQKMIDLPGVSSGIQILDSTSDGRYLVGPGIFRHIGPGELDYEIVNLTGWESAPEALEGVPSTFVGVRKLGEQYFAAAGYVLAETFASSVGVWNLETGELVLTGEAGDTFADLEVIEGQLVLAVQGLNGPAIYAGLGSSRNELADELGFTDGQFSGWNNSLFPGDELGLIVGRYEGPYFVSRVYSIDFLAPPVKEVFDVATTVLQSLYPENVVSLSANRTLTVTVQGAADLDVRQIDRSTLFIGDARHSPGGTIQNIRYTDANGDGWADAVVRVETASTLQPDTSMLRIDFATTKGQACSGTRSVTATSLGWLQYRLQHVARLALGNLAHAAGL